ncbi:histidine phosphatase family protein, partial [Streptomyces sp. NPDC059786]|uniref:histidine phosphatase family protein n=1 Tax=Streptomyces sp. NPDC059786 TaxID=3346946 RepID=UPI00365CF6E7
AASVGERAVSDASVTSVSDARAASVGERAVSDASVTSGSDARAASVGERAVSDASVTSVSDARAASVGERAVSDASVTSVSDARAASVGERAVSDARVTAADLRAARNVATAGAPPADMGAPATFVLLRHGETPLTPQKRFSGSGGDDPGLSEAGRAQAGRVAAALAARGTVRAIVSSPLARCRQTAAVVAARLGLEVAVEDRLRETDFGAWEGLTFAEVRERHPDDLDAWLASADAAPTGGGESFDDVTRRVAAARSDLATEYAGRTVLLVSHVTPIKTLVRLALGAPSESLFRMELSAASLSAIAYYADGNATLRLLNDTSHLR